MRNRNAAIRTAVDMENAKNDLTNTTACAKMAGKELFVKLLFVTVMAMELAKNQTFAFVTRIGKVIHVNTKNVKKVLVDQNLFASTQKLQILFANVRTTSVKMTLNVSKKMIMNRAVCVSHHLKASFATNVFLDGVEKTVHLRTVQL